MKNKSKALLLLSVGLVTSGLFTQPLQADTINGTVAFQGEASASGTSGAGTTTISFVNPWAVTGGNGNYTGTTGAASTMSTISFTGDGAGAVLSTPVTPEWTFTIGAVTYSFNLTALISASVTVAAGGSLSSVSLSGTGTATETGFDDTAAIWTLAGTDGGSLTFTLASENTTAVPDGGLTVALLGFGLVGLETLRRKMGK